MFDPRSIEVVDEQMATVLRAKTGIERLRIASRMYRSAARMIRGKLRADHPDWSEEAITRETARRLSHGAV